MSLNLNKLANKLDEALSNETSETLTKFLTDKRMSNNKQSSVEWLKDQLEHFGNKHELQVSWATVDELVEQAKAMHKEEQVNTFKHAQVLMVMDSSKRAEQFYNETFGGNNKQQ